MDLDLYYEMEGGFHDYITSGGHESQLGWLADTLRRIGDDDSATIIAQLRQKGESPPDDMQPLCERYYNTRARRWELLRQELARQGVDLDERE
jgi:hypothetical protein